MEPMTLAEMVADPVGTIERAHRRGTVIPIEMGEMIIGHEALRASLSDPNLSTSFTDFLRQMGVSSGTFFDWMASSPLDMDGEDHRNWRRLMTKTFTPRSVEKLRPYLKMESEALTEVLAQNRECEFVDAFARKLPALGLCELIGVPKEDRERFSKWADAVGLGFNLMLVGQRIGEIDAALDELLAYATTLVEKRQQIPEDDLVTRLAQAGGEEGVTEVQMRNTIAGLVFAGYETTKNQLGWLVATLAEVPDEWNRVAREPERSKAVVEEVLRVAGTVSSIGRTATDRMMIDGRTIDAGARIVGSLAAANRDPAAFPNPDAFDADAHQKTPHSSFGYGAHHCLGAALARAELQEALIALTHRFTCPRVTGGEWIPPVGIHGPLALHLELDLR